ncbi:MAG: C4-type zinc ribbon domain-containing protein [Kiritimatiellae bacterium]|nr:C4-type zinc ribbon domain-containing protein [Kiritimatiellia bacterium]
MSEIIKKLLDVQECDLQIKDLRKQSIDLPLQKQSEEARLLKHIGQTNQADDALKHAKAEVQNIEIEVKSIKEHIVKLKQQQMLLKSNDEFKAMSHQIETLEKKIQNLEDQELVKMDSVEVMSKNVSEQKKDISREKTIVEEELKIWDTKLKEVKAQLVIVEARREELTVGIPDEALRLYNRMAERKSPAMVPVVDGTCGGCNMSLPAYVIYDAKKQETPTVTCNFCGRFLYESC